MVEEKIRKSICLFCSLGCGVAFRTSGDQVTAIDYDKENPVNHGSLCPRGHYNLEVLNNPALWSKKLPVIKKEVDGIFISSLASNEDAYAATKLAKALGTKNISASADPSDLEAYEGYKWDVPGAKLAMLEDIENSEALLIIGDILTRSPVLSKRINKVKYGKRGNKIIVIDPNKTHTSWFAATHLINKPGTEALLLAAMIKASSKEDLDIDIDQASAAAGIPADKIISAAKDFNSAASGVIVFVPSRNKEKNDLISYFIKVLSGLSPNKKYIIYYLYGNTLGVNTILDREIEGHSKYPEMLKKIDSGEIKSLLMLGETVLPYHPEMQSKFQNLKTAMQPISSQLESEGSYVLADGRIKEAFPVASKAGDKTAAEIVSAILNVQLDIEKAKEIASKGVPAEKAELNEKIREAKKITARSAVPIEDITHFGNNNLVKNFFWYRVNNG